MITVNLTGVTDVQRLGVTLMNVSDGTNTGDVMVPMGVLSGDTGGNGNVAIYEMSAKPSRYRVKQPALGISAKM